MRAEALGRKIGALEISTRRARGCSAAPDQPSTKAKLQMVKAAEQHLAIAQMVKDTLKNAKTMIV